ncbi:MAG: serine/threonine protein kinase [Verrucomicrobiales bacterium]|nr:serine/threonine protein kinase [Verrucomicrobiales bacterium]
MADQPPSQEEAIFAVACELEDPRARRGYLDRACAGNPALRERLERLLRAQEQADRHLGAEGRLPEARLLEEESGGQIAEGPGAVIGRYKLLEQIGEGGFGVVYMAEQEKPVRRRVALKIIKPGMDTRQVVARFEAERQALALMDHPNIAKVLDAGATESGRPYFVMDLVKGIPITEFCDRSRLPVKERLKLFLPVCAAIQHAHQKGVVHRDLKPSNILVTLDYGEPTPKVIDFGVAKALNQRLTEKTLYTQFTQMIGTPAYMSPEQAEMSSLDIDTRTDVYSLGVLLYELLTGTTPLPEERLRSLGFGAIQQAISEEEAEKPSTRVSTLRGELVAVAQHRSTEAGSLGRLLRGDLDWIVLKAIEKDRRRRYDTPGDLATDVRRYLDSEPVVATPPSALYKLRKFARRNKALVSAGAAISVMLLFTSGFSTWQAIRASRSETKAVGAEAAAREEAESSKALLDFLRDDLLSVADPFAGDPNRPRGRDLRLLTAVDLASRSVGDRFKNRPLVEAGIRQTLGQIYVSLNENDQAEAQLSRSLNLYEREADARDLGLLQAKDSQAWLLLAKGRQSEARKLIESVIADLEQVVEPGHLQLLKTRRCLLAALTCSAQIPEAIALGEELISQAEALPPEQTDIWLAIMYDYIWANYQQGNFPRVYALSEQALARARAQLDNDHPQTIAFMFRWATWLRLKFERYREAEALQQEAHDRAKRVLGGHHDLTVAAASELAWLAWARDSFGGFVTRQADLAATTALALGRNDEHALFEQMRLAWARHAEGRNEDAAALLTDAIERLRETQGDEGFDTRRTMLSLSGVRISQGRYDDALSLRRTVLELSRQLDPGSPWTSGLTRRLGNLHARLGQWPEAARLYQSLLPAFEPDRSNRRGELVYPAGFVLARLANDDRAARELAVLALKRATETDHWQTRCEIALTLLLAPQCVADQRALLTLAGRGGADCPNPLRKALLLGITAVRQGEHREAVQALSALTRTSATSEAGLSAALLAVSRHELGDTDQAATDLRRAQELLEQLTRPGDLGHTTYDPGEEWLPVAELILACREADQRIHREESSKRIDDTYLAAARNRWQPVKTLLDQAENLARQGDLTAAHARFCQAVKHEPFNWNAALQSRPGLDRKAAAVFLMAGDQAGHAGFRDWVARHGAEDSRLSLLGMLLPPEDIPADLIESQLNRIRADPQSEGEGLEAKARHSLQLGLAEYCSGDLGAALTDFTTAGQAYSLITSGTAHAIAAMALADLDRQAEARERLSVAEATYQELLDGNPSGFGPSWHDAVILQLLLGEARQRVSRDTSAQLLRSVSG